MTDGLEIEQASFNALEQFRVAYRYTNSFIDRVETRPQPKNSQTQLPINLNSVLKAVVRFLGQISMDYLTLPIAPIGGMLGIAIPAADTAIAYGY